MPRIIRALWFEEVGLLNEPLIDTPIGKLTLRQTFIIMFFAGIAWLASTLVQDVIFKIGLGGAIFISGVAIFAHKVKTLPPEKILWYMIFGSIGVEKPKKLPRKPGEELAAEKPLGVERSVSIASTLDTPVKLVGVLRDPGTGQIFASTPFDAFVNGELVFSGFTDEEGFFTIFFTPATYGVIEVKIKPAKYAGPPQVMRVQVLPKRGEY